MSNLDSINCHCTAQRVINKDKATIFSCERCGGGIWDRDTDLTALPRPRSSGGSLRSLTASMTAARRWCPDPDGAFFSLLLLLLSGDVDEAGGAAGSAPAHEADQKARRLRAGASARRRRAAAPGTAIGDPLYPGRRSR